MNARRWLAAMIPFALFAACVPRANRGSELTNTREPAAVADELLAVDRAFSTSAASLDVTDALEAMFDDSVRLLHPAGVTTTRAEALRVLNTNAANSTSRIAWTPIRAGVSSDGQHGFTQGYINTRRTDGTTLPGKYLAYWVRGDAGWRVRVYKRAGRPAGDVSTVQLPHTLPPAGLARGSANEVAEFAQQVRAAESAFSADASAIGIGPAFRKWGLSDAMHMGGSAEWVFGNEAIAAEQRPLPNGATITWSSDLTASAATGDLGYSIGRISITTPSDAQPRVITFFTIWKRRSLSEPWRYIAE